jgi:hypothetical protein
MRPPPDSTFRSFAQKTGWPGSALWTRSRAKGVFGDGRGITAWGSGCGRRLSKQVPGVSKTVYGSTGSGLAGEARRRNRAGDRCWINLPLDTALKAKVEMPGMIGGGMSPGGCADASLYQRFHALGLKEQELHCSPPLVAVRQESGADAPPEWRRALHEHSRRSLSLARNLYGDRCSLSRIAGRASRSFWG